MCGRYSLTADLEDVQRRFEFIANELTYSPRYNIAPTQPVLAVTHGGGRRASYMRWGLIASWAKSVSGGTRLINARAGNSCRAQQLSNRVNSQKVLGPRRRVLRVAAGGKREKAYADCNEVGRTVCLRWPLGFLA